MIIQQFTRHCDMTEVIMTHLGNKRCTKSTNNLTFNKTDTNIIQTLVQSDISNAHLQTNEQLDTDSIPLEWHVGII